MGDINRNIRSGVFAFILMIVFFSFFQREKDKQSELTPSLISNTNTFCLQAMIGDVPSPPEIGFTWIYTLNSKFACTDFTSGREFIIDNLVSNFFTASHLKSLVKNPVIGLIFPQKVPEQGKEDDILSIS